MKASTITPLKRFISLLKVDKQEITSIYIYALFSGIVSLTLPLGIQAIINLISLGQVSTSWIVLVGLVILGVAFRGFMQIKQLEITENIQQKIFTRSSFEFAYRIPRMKLEAVDKIYTPELVNKFFDTLTVQKGLSKILTDFSTATLQVIFGLILLSLYHPFFIIFSFILITIIYLIFRYLVPMGIKTSMNESKYKYEIAYWLEELARTMSTFKLASHSRYPMDRTDRLVRMYLASRVAHFKTLRTQYTLLVIFKIVIAAGLMILGGTLVLQQQMNVGQFVAAEIIIILIIASVEKLIMTMETIYDILTAVEKIGSVTDIELEHIEETRRGKLDKGLSVEMRDFSYTFLGENKPVIKDISLKIKSGERLVVCGEFGSGKSILIQLIAGFYESYQGSLNYNGLPLGNWDKEDLYVNIGECISKDQIFNGSVLENITLGKEGITLEEVQKMAEIIGFTDFVCSLPEGYQTKLMSEGKNLPRSARTKIMIARALVGNPKLLLLDDTFNNLIPENRKNLLEYLLDRAHNWTVVAVSNDADVIASFDRAIVLKNGQIISSTSNNNSDAEAK